MRAGGQMQDNLPTPPNHTRTLAAPNSKLPQTLTKTMLEGWLARGVEGGGGIDHILTAIKASPNFCQ